MIQVTSCESNHTLLPFVEYFLRNEPAAVGNKLICQLTTETIDFARSNLLFDVIYVYIFLNVYRN